MLIGSQAFQYAYQNPQVLRDVSAVTTRTTVLGTAVVAAILLPLAEMGVFMALLGGVLVMDQIDSSERIDLGVEVVTAGIELGGGVRSPNLMPFPQAPVAPINQTARAVRAHFGWE